MYAPALDVCETLRRRSDVTARVRWMRFNLVGVMGFALQALTLWALVRWTGVTARVAITVAVMAAVSHNFAWHECFTWPNLPRSQRVRRWLAFHLSTGVISLLTNLGVTMLVMTATGLSVLPANVIAVAIASFANFWINDRLIFRPASAVRKSS
jgi:putative flippase GtrA